MHEELKQLYVLSPPCQICNESWFNKKIGPRTKKCDRCAAECRQPDAIPTFGVVNRMIPCDIPEELKGLTYLEERIIALGSPALHIWCRKGGMTGFSGNCISFEQDHTELATKLPRLPKDIPYILMQTPGSKPAIIMVRPDRIWNALVWLKNNNPYYKDIELSVENYDHYRRNEGRVIGLRELAYPHDPDQVELDAEPPLAEKDAITEEQLNNDVPLPDSMVPLITESAPVDELILRAAEEGENQRNNMTRNSSSNNTDSNATAMPTSELHAWPGRKEPMSEFKEGYFTCNFPCNFPNGEGDYTIQVRPGKLPPFKDWAQHMIEQADQRCLKHPVFAMVCANQYQRRSGLSVGNFVATDDSIKELTAKQLYELIKDDKEGAGVLGKLRYMSRNLVGSPQYFYHNSIQALAFVDHIRLRSNDKENFNVFLTLSPADMHWDELHSVLPGSEAYLGKTIVKSVDDIPLDEDPNKFITKAEDYRLRSKAVNDNAGIVSDMFVTKVNLLFKHVLEPILGVKEKVVRYEFQHRGAIHAHCLLVVEGGPSHHDLVMGFQTKLKEQADKFLADARKATGISDDYIAGCMADVAENQAIIAAREKIINFATEHIGISAVHPNLDPHEWPPPYGQNVYQNLNNSLRQNLRDFADSGALLIEDYENLINVVQIHKCMRNYCLKAIPSRKNKDTPAATATVGPGSTAAPAMAPPPAATETILQISEPTESGDNAPEDTHQRGFRLENPGVEYRCYLNSLLNGMLACDKSKAILKNDTTRLGNGFNEILNGSTSSELVRQCLTPQDRFRLGEQNDAHEALSKLLELLPDMEKAMEVIMEVEKECLNCRYKSTDFQWHNCFIKKLAKTTQEMLTTQTKTEEMVCSKCQHDRMKVTTKTENSSQLLWFMGQRVTNNPLQTTVDTNVTMGQKDYQVRAVVTRLGVDTTQGHFFAHIYENNQWWLVDDAKTVSRANSPTGGYLFFYEEVVVAPPHVPTATAPLAVAPPQPMECDPSAAPANDPPPPAAPTEAIQVPESHVPTATAPPAVPSTAPHVPSPATATAPPAAAKSAASKQSNSKKTSEVEMVCRFKYPKNVLGYEEVLEKNSDGTETLTSVNRSGATAVLGPDHPNGAAIVANSSGNMELLFLRNNRRVNEHIKEMTSIWRANTDTKIITSHKQLVTYLSKYIFKGENASTTYSTLCKAVIAKTNGDTSARKALQKAIIKALTRDIPRQEAFMILNRNKQLVEFSKMRRHANLTGSKVINLNGQADEVVVSSDSQHEHYWMRELDENYKKACLVHDADPAAYKAQFLPTYNSPQSPQNTSLHFFMAYFNKDWTASRKEYVPVFSPNYQYPPKVTNEEKYEQFARARLLQHKPGTNPDNVLGNFDCFQEALANFACEPECPVMLIEQMEECLLVGHKEGEDAEDAESPDELAPQVGGE
jgi:hypothetical protein